MDYPENLFSDDIKYSIIDNHIAQIVLLPNESITTFNPNVEYYSENATIKSKRQFFVANPQVTIQNNSKEQIAYVGLSSKSDKIMVIDAAIFQNFNIRDSSILAFQDVIDMSPISQLGVNFQKILFNKNHLMKQQLVFLKIFGTLIDKDLGENETIIVSKDSVIGMQSEIKWEYYQNQASKIKIIGPGRILFQVSNGRNNVTPNQQHRIFLIYFFMLLSPVFLLSGFVQMLQEIE